jgi:hypothetical protein
VELKQVEVVEVEEEPVQFVTLSEEDQKKERKKEDNQILLRIRVKKYLVGTLAELLGYGDELQEVDYKSWEFHVHLHSHQHTYLDKTWNSPCSHLSHSYHRPQGHC